jgi:hypothetical protein
MWDGFVTVAKIGSGPFDAQIITASTNRHEPVLAACVEVNATPALSPVNKPAPRHPKRRMVAPGPPRD